MKTTEEDSQLAEIAKTVSTGILLSFLKTALPEDADYIKAAKNELASREASQDDKHPNEQRLQSILRANN